MNIAIAGYGVEGEANYNYFVQQGHDVTIYDEAEVPGRPVPNGAKFHNGPKIFRGLHDYDMVVRTASLPPHFIVTDGKVWSSTNEFFATCPAPIIGVTGTKGKGTTSSLITSILRAAGHTVHLVGNIGQPPLAILHKIKRDHIVVFEMSSFQLWDLERSPHVAVVLMIEPDHLDVHADFKDYIRAKSNIRRHQTADDVCFYHPSNEWSAKIAKASVLGDHIRYNTRDAGSVYAEDGEFRVEGETICSVSELSLPGAHNIENACAAISAARVFTLDNRAIEKGLRVFEGLPHRLKFIREIDGVKYYDDNYSSAPLAIKAAIYAFDVPELLICGGYDRKLDFDSLAKSIVAKGNVKRVIVYGQTKHRIAEALRANGYTAIDLATIDDLNLVVKKARSLADKGDVIIMSPGCPSFDMFKNFTERGEKFVSIVNSL